MAIDEASFICLEIPLFIMGSLKANTITRIIITNINPFIKDGKTDDLSYLLESFTNILFLQIEH